MFTLHYTRFSHNLPFSVCTKSANYSGLFWSRTEYTLPSIIRKSSAAETTLTNLPFD